MEFCVSSLFFLSLPVCDIIRLRNFHGIKLRRCIPDRLARMFRREETICGRGRGGATLNADIVNAGIPDGKRKRRFRGDTEYIFHNSQNRPYTVTLIGGPIPQPRPEPCIKYMRKFRLSAVCRTRNLFRVAFVIWPDKSNGAAINVGERARLNVHF